MFQQIKGGNLLENVFISLKINTLKTLNQTQTQFIKAIQQSIAISPILSVDCINLMFSEYEYELIQKINRMKE